MKKTLPLLLLTLILPLQALASITGRLLDAADKSPLIEASLRLVKANRDSTYAGGTTSDASGAFSIPVSAPGKYVLKISYIGYNSLRRNVTIPQSGRVSLGDIEMSSSSIMLKEATVVGVKTEITVKEDTVEYNADSYKTQVNAVVEDLLKRLPGVEVDNDGKITANGKTISKILVDGKEFFADDTKATTKNLPANIVDKLQVIDRKSDLARLTGVDDGEDETVINLTVKKGMKQGWFGNLVAGYGTDNRYGARGMVNRMVGNNHFSLMFGANNTNNMGFSDGGDGRFNRRGGAGINKSQVVGFDFNVGNTDIFRAGGNVMYSRSDRDSQSQKATSTTYSDYSKYTDSKSLSNAVGNNVRADFRIIWQPDSFNTLEFRPNMQLNFNDSWENSLSYTRHGQDATSAAKINNSLEQSIDNGKSYEFGGRLIYNYKFRRHRGRSLSAMLRYSYSNRHEDENDHTLNEYEDAATDDEDIAQLIKNHVWSNRVQGRVTWTEPLGNVARGNFLQLAYNVNYRFNNSDKNVYDRLRANAPATAAALARPSYGTQYFMDALLQDDALRSQMGDSFGFSTLDNEQLLYDILARDFNFNQALDEFNHNQSTQFRNNFLTQEFQLGYQKTTKQINLNIGMNMTGTMQESKDLLNPERNIQTQWLWNPAPYARFRWKITKTRSLQLFYRARAEQPSVTQLQPVPDVSNPMAVKLGNPDLKATFAHNINLRFNDFNQESQRSWMLGGNFSYTKNNISSVSLSDMSTGKRVSTYANLAGNWNLFVMGMFSVPLRNKAFYFRSFSRLGFSKSSSYNAGHADIASTDFTKASQILNYVNDDMLNTNSSLNFNISPGITFRNNITELDIRPNYGAQIVKNSISTQNNRTIHNYGGSFNGTLRLLNFTLNTDLRYSATKGYDQGFDNTQWIWNASLEYQFLRGKNATIGVKAYDILGQRKAISLSASGETTSQSWNNTLGRYVLFTASYTFKAFGKGQKGETVDYDGMGPDRRGPMGPPPGGRGGFGGGRRF